MDGCGIRRVNAVSNTNQVILISGGTQGLGLAIANQLIAQGCTKVAITGRNPEKGKAAMAHLKAQGADALYVQCDAASIEDCQNVVSQTIDYFGTVDGLINAAADTSRGTLLDSSPELWDRHMNINLRAPFLLMQGVARHLVEQGKGGSIVNILSTSAHVGQSFLTAYSTSKGGLMTLTKNAANAMRHQRIRVNAIAPGWMDTPNEDAVQKEFHGADDNWLKAAEASLPMGQLVKPHQLAPLAAYLLSPNSGVITGAIIDYDQQIVGVMPE